MRRGTAITDAEREDAQRLDKWLCYARFAKTRAVAQALVEGGKIRVNRERVTHSSRLIRASDVLTIRLAREVRVVRVLGFAKRRVSPKDVSGLYEGVTEGAASRGA